MAWNKKRWFLRNFGFGKKAAEEESIEETESKETAGEETAGKEDESGEPKSEAPESEEISDEEPAAGETESEKAASEETSDTETESAELKSEAPETGEPESKEDELSDITAAECSEGKKGSVEPAEESAGDLQGTVTGTTEKPAEAKCGAPETKIKAIADAADKADVETAEADADVIFGENIEEAAEAYAEQMPAETAEKTVGEASDETTAVAEETEEAAPAETASPEPEETAAVAEETEEAALSENTEKVIPAAEDPAAENKVETTTITEEETKAMAMEKAEDALETSSSVTEETAGEECEHKAIVQDALVETVEEAAEPGEQKEVPADEQGAVPADEQEAVPAEEGEEAVPAEESEAVADEQKAAPADVVEVPADEQADASASETKAGEVSLDSLEPANVFGFFRQIAAIPHGSYHTEAISDYLEEFAKERNLDYMRDGMGNLIISRPGSDGCEDVEPIALQGHIDMVCEKEDSIDIDMDTQPITLMTDGKWLTADRTTLGGDDGIAVAIMLALLDDKTIKCPPLECIFTVDEEVGLLGATEIDLSSLKSRKMINLDSEEEGIITASCAGGAEMVCTLSGKRKMKGGIRASLEVSGLTGGHSGEKIAEERGNAVLILARLLYRLGKEGKYCICSLEGGRRNNAIPRSARAEILFTGKVKRKNVLALVREFADEVKAEFAGTDPEMNISVELSEKGIIEHGKAFKRSDSMRIVNFLMLIPNGVIEYVPGYGDIPRTSLSLGIAATTEDGFRTNSLVRSSMNSRKEMVMDKIFCLAEEFDAHVDVQGAYPAWELVVESDFRKLAKDVYSKVTGKEAVVNFIHAGLECGILSAKVEGLECISIGPDMEDVHTPAEKLDIASSGRIYAFVKELLAECAESR